MGEIKKKLNIGKITVKNITLLVLVMVLVAVMGAITKTISVRSVTNTAKAQIVFPMPGPIGCWPVIGGEACNTGCEGTGTGDGSEGCCSEGGGGGGGGSD